MEGKNKTKELLERLKNQIAAVKSTEEFQAMIKALATFHDLRHCFNTNARKAGVHDHVIMAITGHTTLEMFERYDTVDEEDILDAMEKLEEKCSETAAREFEDEKMSRK